MEEKGSHQQIRGKLKKTSPRHIRTYKTRRIQGSTGYQANSAETSKTYESEALMSIKSIANVSIEDCKTMKTIAYTKTEFFKKVAELTENLAADLKVKGI